MTAPTPPQRGKPVTFHMVRPMLTQGQAEYRPFWDQVWAHGRAFRHCLRVQAAAVPAGGAQ